MNHSDKKQCDLAHITFCQHKATLMVQWKSHENYYCEPCYNYLFQHNATAGGVTSQYIYTRPTGEKIPYTLKLL